MPPQTQAFDDLNSLPDALHAWIAHLSTSGRVDADVATLLALALHEWTANLVQHASWSGAVRVVVSVAETGGRFHCSVEDTSSGFDLAGALHSRRVGFEGLPERGMGLLMLDALADGLDYAPVAPPSGAAAPRHRLRFRLRTDGPGLDVTHTGLVP